MSYHIYTTKGLVLSAYPRREADRTYAILTRDLGLIYATAGGVRKEVSKLKAALEPLSVSSISLVKGKESWRLTSASLTLSIPEALKGKKDTLIAFARVFQLAGKMVVGESVHPELFDQIEKVLWFVLENNLENKEAENIEILLAARILFELGYISTTEVPENILKDELSAKLLAEINENKKVIVKAINDGIYASDLTK